MLAKSFCIYGFVSIPALAYSLKILSKSSLVEALSKSLYRPWYCAAEIDSLTNSEKAVGAVVDKVSDVGIAISKNAQDSFNRSMEAARKRREMEMRFAQEGMTAGDLGRYAEESLAQAAGTVGTALSPITGAAEELTPDLGVGKAIAESSVGQTVGALTKEYPRTTRNTLNALEAGSWFPGAKFLGRTANAVIDNGVLQR